MLADQDIKDIQGLVLFGYKHAPFAKYIFLQISNVTKAKAWLGGVANELNRISKKLDKDRQIINLAFTYEGFETLGLYKDTLSGFSAEFIQGIDTPHRNRVLGDTSESGPEHWRWGGKSNDEIHIVACLYSNTETRLAENLMYHRAKWKRAGLIEVHELAGHTLYDDKEHFGFRDGVSQPVMDQVGRSGAASNMIKTGEFVLGYDNEYDEIGHSPLVKQSNDPSNELPYRETYKDFGRNGSYMVFRQLSQDVTGFWQYMQRHSSSYDEMVKVASKMVGRWPSGAPITKYRDADPGIERDRSQDDSFGYRDEDAEGLGCPIASHLRRSNPRDALPNASSSEASTTLVNRHRILRRGRAYGQPISETISPKEILEAKGRTHEETGLHFICFNTNIATQFEFIQHDWINRSTFAGLYDNSDPVTGNCDESNFTVPQDTISKRFCNIPRFVQTRGGQYFFLPGVRAVRFLSTLS